MRKNCFECDMYGDKNFICEGCKKGLEKEKELRRYLNKVMRRKVNQCKDWLSFDLAKNEIVLYSLIRGNKWTVSIDEFKEINK